ncbi:MAG TPA: hypothetical protein VGC91_08525 [Pyrinomonadaceae bacterium]
MGNSEFIHDSPRERAIDASDVSGSIACSRRLVILTGYVPHAGAWGYILSPATAGSLSFRA